MSSAGALVVNPVEPLVFVSDVHIASGTSPAAERFGAFLRALPGRVRELFILGDLFDIWVEHSDADLDDYRRVLTALYELDRAGVSVSFISGNRDFFFRDYLLKNVSIHSYAEKRIINLDGKRVQLCHGDLLCTRDRWHLRLRRVLCSRGFRAVFFALPTTLAHYLSGCLRRHSKRAVKSKCPATLDVNERALRNVFSSDVDVIICGHTHRGEHRTFNVGARRCELFVLDAWCEHSGFLEYRDGAFTRGRFSPQ